MATNAHRLLGGTVPDVIGYLRGRALSPNLILTSGDVGYVVHTVTPLVPGEDVEVHVTTLVREDAITLYGFDTAAAQELFVVLNRVRGVGPAVAFALLRDLGPGPLVAALVAEDARALTAAAGVGPKKAGELVLLTKGKVPAALAAAFVDTAPPAPGQAGPHADLIATLTSMGFPEAGAAEAVTGVARTHPDADDAVLLRRALVELNARPTWPAAS